MVMLILGCGSVEGWQSAQSSKVLGVVVAI
jgi:hypothetical protein